MSDNYEYRTRPNGDVELSRDGQIARVLTGDDAKRFSAQVKDGDVQQVLAQFVDVDATRQAGSQDQGHPATDDPLPGPTPHGDGAVREKDGEQRPTD